MIKLIIGFVLGTVVSQVGFGGIARILDNSVERAKTQVEILAKWFWQTGIQIMVDHLLEINYNMYMC